MDLTSSAREAWAALGSVPVPTVRTVLRAKCTAEALPLRQRWGAHRLCGALAISACLVVVDGLAASAQSSGNILRGMACVENGRNNIVVSEGGHLTAVLGLDNLVVVHTADATLVCPKDQAQEIKALLKRLQADARTQKYL